MSSGITNKDSLFFAGATPWHGMGTKLERIATAAEAIVAASLGWTVTQEPVKTAAGVELEGSFINLRQDTGDPLGVVGSRYRILQNEEAFRFFDRVTQDPNGPKYEVAGSLWGGRIVWLLAKLPDIIEVVKGDIVEPYLLLMNSHDGSSAVRVMETPIRVVCQNTLNMALASNGRRTSIRHSGDIFAKVANVQDALGIIRGEFGLTGDLFKRLAQVEYTTAQRDSILRDVFPDTKSDRAKLQRDRALALAVSGKGNAPVSGTGWGLYNGITELLDHFNGADSKREDANDMRLFSLSAGSGYATKARALEVIADTLLR